MKPPLILVFGSALALLLGACLLLTPRLAPTPDEDAIYTSGAETFSARLTSQAGMTAVFQLTAIAGGATQTHTPPAVLSPGSTTAVAPGNTPAVAASDTPVPTVASQPTATSSLPCDQAQFISHITIPPGTNLPTGAAFQKTWRVQNSGACAWNSSYSLVFTAGDTMGSATVLPLPGTIQPGQTVDLSASMVAPHLPGIYQGNWQLRSPSGAIFGVGASGQEPLVVRITAVQPVSSGNYEDDLAANFCAALWQSAAGVRPCPGDSSDAGGSVVLVEGPLMENGRQIDWGLWVRPNQDRLGWISGQYPAYTVQRNDHFLAQVGCLASSPGCSLVFQLDYQSQNGSSGRLGSWREAYDGAIAQIDIDLSTLAGQRIALILTSSNNGRAGEANGVWLAPRVENRQSASNLALDWIQQVPGETVCNQLEVYLTSALTARAVAYDCVAGQVELGWTDLSADEFSQLSGYLTQLQTFKGEVFRAGTTTSLSSRFTLYGRGRLNASDNDIQTINGLAVRLFSRITGGVIVQ